MGDSAGERYAILIPGSMFVSPVSITLTYAASVAFQMGVDISSDLLAQPDNDNQILRARVAAGYRMLVFHDLTDTQRQLLADTGAGVIEPLALPSSPFFRAAVAVASALGRAGAEYLIRYGRRNIAFVHAGTSSYARITQLRYAGVLQACVAAGVKAPELVSCAGDLAQVARAFHIHAEKGQAFDGFVCHDDVAAMRTVAALRMLGRVVPYDGSVIGMGDSGPVALFSPSITSVAIDYRKLGGVFGEAIVATLRHTDYEPPSAEWLDGIIHIVPRDSA